MFVLSQNNQYIHIMIIYSQISLINKQDNNYLTFHTKYYNICNKNTRIKLRYDCNRNQNPLEIFYIYGGNMSNLLKPKQAAEILGVGYRKIIDLIHTGDLKAIKVGSHFRIEPTEIERYKSTNVVHVVGMTSA